MNDAGRRRRLDDVQALPAQSTPALIVCRPFTHVSVSAIWVTLVLKSVAVFAGEPSC